MPKIAYAQMKVAAGHPDINTKKILQLIDEARAGGADVIIFSECVIPGQMTGYTWIQKSFLHEWEICREEIIAAAKDIKIVLGETVSKKFSGEGFDVIFSSEPFSLNKNIYTEKIVRPTIYVCDVGVQNTGKTIYTFDGGSAVFNSRGEIVQYAEPFAEYLNFIELDEIDNMPAIKLPEISETEKIYRALSYGVKEFLAQIGMSKVVIGVSGGIDSAVAAALYVQVVGAENVYLVNMPSRFNSATTKNLSEQLAKNLGCKYFVVPIQESVDWTVKQLEGVGLSVSDFVKENIQARDRSARILAAIAASVGGVFTCNANKAETTVGYATLYGDEAGFLSALADLWKFQVYDLARYMNEKIYGFEAIPQGIIDIVPITIIFSAPSPNTT